MKFEQKSNSQVNTETEHKMLCKIESLEFTPEEAAKFLHCSRRQLYYLLKHHEFNGTYYRIGRRVFFSKEKLQEWKDAGGTEHNFNNV